MFKTRVVMHGSLEETQAYADGFVPLGLTTITTQTRDPISNQIKMQVTFAVGMTGDVIVVEGEVTSVVDIEIGEDEHASK